MTHSVTENSNQEMLAHLKMTWAEKIDMDVEKMTWTAKKSVDKSTVSEDQ